IADAQALPALLTGEAEPLDLAGVVLRVVHDQVIALAVAPEIPVHDARAQDAFGAAPLLEPREDRLDVVLDEALVLLVRALAFAELPLAAEERDGVDEGVDSVEVDRLDHARAEEWGLGNVHV